MEGELGLSEIGSFDSDGLCQLYNNYIGLEVANLYKTVDPIYGGSGEETLFLQIDLFHDEFSREIEGIEVIDEESCLVRPSEDLLWGLVFFMEKFFGDAASQEFQGISSTGIWGVPKTIDIIIFTDHPETFDECLGWAARFERSAFLAKASALTFGDLDQFFSEAQDYHDSVVIELMEKYGGES